MTANPISTRSLGEATEGQVYDSLPIDLDSPLVLDKAARNKLVLLDPSCAPFIRQAIGSQSIRRWHYAHPEHWLIAIPRGWTAATLGRELTPAQALQALGQRHAALAAHLARHEQALRERAASPLWWELPPYPVDFFAAQSIIWAAEAPLRAAPSLAGVHLLAGITLTTAPTTFLLGALGSRRVEAAAAALPSLGSDDSFGLPIPQPSEQAQARIGELAEQLVIHARDRAELERDTLRKIMRDLTPAGATPGPRMARWWDLSFADFEAELVARFASQMPFRYRDGWAKLLNERRVQHQVHDATMAGLEAELEACMAS